MNLLRIARKRQSLDEYERILRGESVTAKGFVGAAVVPDSGKFNSVRIRYNRDAKNLLFLRRTKIKTAIVLTIIRLYNCSPAINLKVSILSGQITLLNLHNGEIMSLGSNQPLLSGANGGSKNLRFENHLVAPMEIPAVRFHDFGICIELNSAETGAELRDKRRSNRSHFDPCEVCVVPPLTEIKQQFLNAHLEMIYWHFDPVFIKDIAAETADSDWREIHPKLTVNDRTIQNLALIVRDKLAGGSVNGNLFVESLENALAVHLLRNYSAARLPEIRGGLTRRQLRSVFEYINDNLTEDVSLGEIAGVISKSRYHFSRQFKQSTGLSVHRYLQEQRIKLAKILLANRNITITDIAQRTGFLSHSRFSALFRRLTGITPANYRKKL